MRYQKCPEGGQAEHAQEYQFEVLLEVIEKGVPVQ